MTRHLSLAPFVSVASSPLPSRRSRRSACCFTSDPARPFYSPLFRQGATYASVSFSTNISPSTLHRPWSTSTSLLYANASELQPLPLATPFAVVIAAIVLAVAAQSWINFLLRGDRGLGAFLSDGSGYNKSAFKPRKTKTEEDAALGETDPLPWLNLPHFEYVDVAGQPKPPKKVPLEPLSADGNEQSAQEIVSQMELRRSQMSLLVEQGRLQEAKTIEMELQQIMKEHGYEFKSL